jgi:hypothetical protein
VRATILAPVYFMDNLHFGKEQLAKGIYAAPLPPTDASRRSRSPTSGRRRSPPRGPRPLRRQALRHRERRADGLRRCHHPLANHRSPVQLFPGPTGRHPPAYG